MQIITHSPSRPSRLAQILPRRSDRATWSRWTAIWARERRRLRGVLRGLGYPGRVTSPTFAIANEYSAPDGTVVHFDLYRILDEEALFELGFEEYLDGTRILLIEWSENAGGLLPVHHKSVRLTYGEQPDDRLLEIEEIHETTEL
ncbi:MAG: tRNA (adenosine(37)-N6)-threonylcarbamoyltransferase complex ATPase subunit type 1 TsaE [Butyricicoccus pullicaecorum]